MSKHVVSIWVWVESDGEAPIYTTRPFAVADDIERAIEFVDDQSFERLRALWTDAIQAGERPTLGSIFVRNTPRFSEQLIEDYEFRLKVLNWLERNFALYEDDLRLLAHQQTHEQEVEARSEQNVDHLTKSSFAQSFANGLAQTRINQFEQSPLTARDADEIYDQQFRQNYAEIVLNVDLGDEFNLTKVEALEFLAWAGETIFEVTEVQQI